MKATISAAGDNLHIDDSAFVSKKNFGDILDDCRRKYAFAVLWRARSIRSMKLEWATHNALYALGIARERTKDVDLDTPQQWYYRVGYAVVGAMVWAFIK